MRNACCGMCITPPAVSRSNAEAKYYEMTPCVVSNSCSKEAESASHTLDVPPKTIPYYLLRERIKSRLIIVSQ